MAFSLSAAFLQRWQKLKPGQRVAAALLGSLLLFWVMDWISLKPLRQRLRALRDEVNETEKQLLGAIEANHNAAAVSKAFVAYAPYASPSASPEAELAALLTDVESGVRQSGVVLLNLKPANRTGADGSISVAVDGESSPEQLMRLLDQFQRSSKAIQVTELSLRVSESKTLRVALVVSKLLLK